MRAVPTAFVAPLVAGLALALGCRPLDDPSIRPADTARFDAPAPPLREAGHDPMRNVFFGDLHVHSAYSYDAFRFGVRALPDDAYRYAKGETIEHGAGYPIRISRPLDFLAVTDHAEYLGVARDRAERGVESPASLPDILATGSPLRITVHFLRTTLGVAGNEQRAASFGGADAGDASATAWQEIRAAAARHDDPGRFTSFVGYEWTSMPDEQNLHRNVIYRSGRVPDVPFSALDSDDPEDLWHALEAQRERGMDALAISHNGNASNGLMYDRETLGGVPLDAAYARLRMQNEPISEILQVKGQSEVHPLLAGDDEFADFEIYDRQLSARGPFSQPEGSYSRQALGTGLELERTTGENPYRFGVIGSSDGHNASSPVEEDRYHGKLPLIDGTAGLRLNRALLLPRSVNRGGRWSAMGLAAVWAEENTRPALFDALRRKEAYATSGPRIVVRFFAGAGLRQELLGSPNMVANADAEGVPMGGSLIAEAERPPGFLVSALKDPAGANLDRIQIIKGWIDETGRSHERIHDVAASDGRRPDPATGRVTPVASTVDPATATFRNTWGAARLEAFWRDPDFDASQPAFYYARVIEIATPRWSTHDAVLLGVAPPHPVEIQERAITSAIWVDPAPVP